MEVDWGELMDSRIGIEYRMSLTYVNTFIAVTANWVLCLSHWKFGFFQVYAEILNQGKLSCKVLVWKGVKMEDCQKTLNPDWLCPR